MSNILFDTEVTQVYHGNVEIPVLPSQYEYIPNEDQVYTIQLQKKNQTLPNTYKITPKIVRTNSGILKRPSPIPAKYAPTTNTGSSDADVKGILVIASILIILVAKLMGTCTSLSITSVTPQ